MQRIDSLLTQGKPIWACAPANYNASTAAAKYVSMKNYARLTIIINTGAWAAGTAAVTVNQATAVAGTGAKALSFDYYHHDETTSGTLVKTTCTNTFNLDTANKMYIIEVDAATLDHANGFDCASIAVASPGANDDYYSVTYILHGNRYAAPTPPTALLD